MQHREMYQTKFHINGQILTLGWHSVFSVFPFLFLISMLVINGNGAT